MSVESELATTRTLDVGKIHQGDCIELMRKIESGTIDLVFADPPFNIGYEYDEYHDRQADEEYIEWSRQWMEEVHRVLKPGGTFWLSIGDEYAAELKVDAEHKIGFSPRSWVVWYYTFGVNCTKKFSRSHVHLFHFVKDEANFTFNAEDPQIRVPSARALVYADKRANPAGRLPDDTWVLRPQDLPAGFQPTDDTWYYARVAGTFKERQGFHGCQMPEQLLGRIIRVSSNPGDTVLDPFAGSGTTLAVAKKLGRKWMGCELSEEYVRAATERIGAIESGVALDGAADPIASAPSTANGRQLSIAGFAATQELIEKPSASDEKQSAIREKVASRRSATVTEAATPKTIKRELRDVVRDAIVDSFYAVNEGASIDWLLADPALQSEFHDRCRECGLIGSPFDWNRELLRFRKTGEFPKRGQLKKVHVTDEELDSYSFAAEIAWRMTSHKFDGSSLDGIFCDPVKAAFFDRAARRVGPGFSAAQYRWGALRLRKASRELVNEVKQYHFVFAKRDFTRFQLWKGFKPKRLNGAPGLYLLRDLDKQPLFIGNTLDLGERLARHIACSAVSEEVAHVSFISGADLPSAEYRDAFKEDLVRRHSPRWNVNLVGLSSTSVE
ncbi:MAG TPA: DNA methyltransferase [Lacipirellulaceae bacterium]|jgi:site-specific DNA-methyltransferase (adenine-specific)|nr:DNA methyltransferase [Lacipirellulaceae bacterium]